MSTRLVSVKQKCFWVQRSMVNYEANKVKCASMDAEMVSIHSSQENDFVYSLTKSGALRAFKRGGWYWIGLRRVGMNVHRFEWSDGQSIDFKNWGQKQPDEIYKADGGCIYIDMNRKWDDMSCLREEYYEPCLTHSKVYWTCPEEADWTQWNRKCIWIGDSMSTFQENEQKCQEKGSQNVL
ncbi:macrophage mannose receptor 1-like isoform X2 [Leptotrombidium deliense]|uniref:Macrophage mannose receptor 1-like isoform X2 n=1 Tax=Leptotrombidium deliense TaxID=299467 RepID=A0A443S4E1_9ACAR|nr:macrophage mannose receptor 1-like isoform X2 [Leptotrombidium deliense]